MTNIPPITRPPKAIIDALKYIGTAMTVFLVLRFFYQLVTEPSRRLRCGASQNLKLCFSTSSSLTSTPRPGASFTG